MKRSSFIAQRTQYWTHGDMIGATRGKWTVDRDAEADAQAAEAAGVIWDPEEPEGFADFLREWQSVPRLHTPPDLALAAWNACLAHAKEKRQGKQWFEGMTFEEIDAHLEAGTFPGAMTPGSWVRVPSDFMTWKARKSRQEAQQRTIETKVDPEVRRKEIEAQIEGWLEYYGITPGCPAQLISRHSLRGMALRLLGVP